MEQKSIKKNYIYNTTFQIVALLLSVITIPYVSRVLGADNVGKYSFSFSIVSYFTIIATYGSSLFGQRQISFHRDDAERLSESFWNLFAFRVIASAAMMCCYFVFLSLWGGVNVVNIIMALNLVAIATDINWLFQGLELFRQVALRNMGVKALCVLLIFLCVRSRDDLWIYTLIMCISVIGGNLAMWLSVKKYIRKPHKIRPFANFRSMTLVFLPTVATQVYMVLDKSMLGFIVGSDYLNGCYEQSEKIARVALTIITSLGAVILPRVSNLYKKGMLEDAKYYIYKSYRFVWLLAFPMATGLAGIASILIPVFLGSGYDDGIILLEIFSMLIIIVSAAYITGLSYLLPTEQQNVYTIAVTASAIINLVMNAFLIRRYQAAGAAISSVTAEAIGLIIQIVYCRATGQLELRKMFDSAWKYVASSAVMLAVIIFMKQRMNTSLFSLLFITAVASVFYFIMVILLRDEFVIGYLKRFKTVLIKK